MAKIPTMGLAVGGIPDVYYNDIVGGNQGGWIADGVAPLQVDQYGQLYIVWNEVKGQTGEPITGSGIVVGGSHSDNFEPIAVSATGHVIVDFGSGTFTTADAILDATVATAGAAKPTTGQQVGGNDGTDFRVLLTDSTGQLKVLVENTSIVVTEANLDATITTVGAARPAKVLVVGGSDYSSPLSYPINVSSDGVVQVQDGTLDGTVNGFGFPVTSSGIIVAASDGTNAQPLLVDGSGNLKVTSTGGGGNASVSPTGSAVPADATAIGGKDHGTGDLVIPLVSTGSDTPNGAGFLMTLDQWNSAVAQTDPGSGQTVYGVGGFIETTETPQALLFNADGELLVNSSGAAGGPTPIAGTLGSLNPALLSTPGGLLRVQVDELPELDIDFPDPSEYIDQDLSLAVSTLRYPAPPNSLQITTSMTPLVMPVVGNGITNISRPLWDEPGAASSSGNLPIGAYYSANTSPNTTAFQVPLVAKGAGMCVAVTVYNLSGSQWANSCAIRLRNNSNGITANWQITPLLTGAGASTPWVGAVTLYFNMPVSTNDSLSIDVLAASTLAGFAVAAVVVPQPMPVQLRPDGRSLPMGSLTVESTAGTGSASSVTLLAAVTGFRYLIYTMNIACFTTSAAENGYIETTIGGVAQFYLVPDVAGANNFVSIPQGQLCDANTVVTLGANTTTAVLNGTVTYDLVPA